MGPTVILDKSALQSLSQEEAGFLFKHYYVNILPVLVIEILGDLKKYAGDKARSELEVRKLTDKLMPIDSKVNAHYRILIEGSLLGYPIEMDGRIIIPGGTPMVDSKGEKGVFLEEAPEEAALRRWRESEFTGTEELLAERWRDVTRGFDIEGFKRQLRKVYKLDKRIGSYGELNQIGTRSTNRVDLEYLFYLPFCMVFSSGDSFQSTFCQGFIGKNCTFVKVDILKEDLKGIAAHWKDLTEEQKLECAYDYGSYPPPNEESFTYQIWKKHMKPWKPGSGNKAVKMTEEEEQKILEFLRPKMEAIKKLEKKRS